MRKVLTLLLALAIVMAFAVTANASPPVTALKTAAVAQSNTQVAVVTHYASVNGTQIAVVEKANSKSAGRYDEIAGNTIKNAVGNTKWNTKKVDTQIAGNIENDAGYILVLLLDVAPNYFEKKVAEKKTAQVATVKEFTDTAGWIMGNTSWTKNDEDMATLSADATPYSLSLVALVVETMTAPLAPSTLEVVNTVETAVKDEVATQAPKKKAGEMKKMASANSLGKYNTGVMTVAT